MTVNLFEEFLGTICNIIVIIKLMNQIWSTNYLGRRYFNATCALLAAGPAPQVKSRVKVFVVGLYLLIPPGVFIAPPELDTVTSLFGSIVNTGSPIPTPVLSAHT